MALNRTLKRIRSFLIIILLYLLYTKYLQIFLFLLAVIVFRMFRKHRMKTDTQIRITLEQTALNLDKIRELLITMEPIMSSEDHAKIEQEVNIWDQQLAQNLTNSIKTRSSKRLFKFKIKMNMPAKVLACIAAFLLYTKYPQLILIFAALLLYRWWKGKRAGEGSRIAHILRLTTYRLVNLMQNSTESILSLQRQVKSLYARLPAPKNEEKDLAQYERMLSPTLDK